MVDMYLELGTVHKYKYESGSHVVFRPYGTGCLYRYKYEVTL